MTRQDITHLIVGDTATRQEIIDLIRNEYDKAPEHFPYAERADWDDGAERIADQIIGDAAHDAAIFEAATRVIVALTLDRQRLTNELTASELRSLTWQETAAALQERVDSMENAAPWLDE